MSGRGIPSHALNGSGGEARGGVEHLVYPERTALGEVAFGQPGLEGGAGTRVSVAVIQDRTGKRFQAWAVVNHCGDAAPLLANRRKPDRRARWNGRAASQPKAPIEFHRFTQLGPKDFTGLAA